MVLAPNGWCSMAGTMPYGWCPTLLSHYGASALWCQCPTVLAPFVWCSIVGALLLVISGTLGLVLWVCAPWWHMVCGALWLVILGALVLLPATGAFGECHAAGALWSSSQNTARGGPPDGQHRFGAPGGAVGRVVSEAL